MKKCRVPISSIKSERLIGTAQAVFVAMAGLASGFREHVYFPLNNNFFHVPIVLRYFHSAEGPHDAFHKSLDGFVSWFWPVLALVVTEQNIEALFVAGVILSRALTILAIYFLIVSAARRSWELALFVALLSFLPLWPEYCFLGGGEIMTRYLTHSQYATALCIFAVALAVRQRWWSSVFLCGFVANINIFLAFWTVVVIVGTRTVLDQVSNRRLPFRFLIGAPAAFVILALPTLYWILAWTLSAPEYHRFSFVEFLYVCLPYHTYIHLEWRQAVKFSLVSSAVLLLWYRIFPVHDGLKNLGFLFGVGFAVLLLGAFAAYMTDSRMILMLHPLRFASVIGVVCASLFIALLENAKEAVEKGHSTVWGAELSPTSLVHLMGRIFSLSGRHNDVLRGNKIPFLVVGVLMLAGLASFSGRGLAPLRYERLDNMIAVQQWARRSTPPDTIFYAAAPGWDFSTLSRRPVWWSKHQGIAVMWAPWFHEQWETRRKLVGQVKTMEELMDLCRREKIAYLVLEHPMLEYAVGRGILFNYRNPDFGVVAIDAKGG